MPDGLVHQGFAVSGRAQVASDVGEWDALCIDYAVGPQDREGLDVGPGWDRRWAATWRVSGDEVVTPVREVAGFALEQCEPVRGFSWSTAQRHRPSLEFMVSTGRLHGCESGEEARVLLALDFATRPSAVLSQPFKLSYRAGGAVRHHIPDLLVRSARGVWLIDVRPAARIKADDRVAFAAAAEAALACGWRYAVAAGFRPQVYATLQGIAQWRRDPEDHFGLRPVLVDALRAGPLPFGDLVGRTALGPVARAQAIYLIWRRVIGIDLAKPLVDSAVVWLGADVSEEAV